MMEPGAAGSHGQTAENLAADPFSAQIHVHNIAPLLICQLQKGDDGFNACVVHQHIDRPKLFLHPVEHGLHLAPLADVCLDHQGTPALVLDPLRNFASFLA